MNQGNSEYSYRILLATRLSKNLFTNQEMYEFDKVEYAQNSDEMYALRTFMEIQWDLDNEIFFCMTKTVL